jgi:hypothetical protein
MLMPTSFTRTEKGPMSTISSRIPKQHKTVQTIDGNRGSQRTGITKTIDFDVEYLGSLPDGSGARKS